MHGDHETGQDAAFLPPFIARPQTPGQSRGGDMPLPPWSSSGRELAGGAADGAAHEASPEPIEAVGHGEPWLMAPEPSEGEETASLGAEEPWPGDELAGTASGDAGPDPWAPVEEPGHAEEPWALPEPATPAEAEPWLAVGNADEALVLDETTDEADEPWLMGAAGPWEEGVVLEEPVMEAEPWTARPAAPLDRPESDLPPAPASPLDELVETAGQALAGSASAWAEAPLETWPGEAEAWDAAAAGSETAGAQGEGVDLHAMADLLDDLADDLRARGAAALEPAAGRDRLGSALASFLAGWRAAARRDG